MNYSPDQITKRNNWFNLIDNLINEDGNHEEYFDCKIYKTKSGKLIHIDRLDNNCLLNCLNYVKRNNNYPNREKYIEIMTATLRYRLLKSGKSEDYFQKFIKGDIKDE